MSEDLPPARAPRRAPPPLLYNPRPPRSRLLGTAFTWVIALVGAPLLVGLTLWGGSWATTTSERHSAVMGSGGDAGQAAAAHYAGAMAALGAVKTQTDGNRSAEMLRKSLAAAEASVAAWPMPEAVGLVTLHHVWSHRWTWVGARWNPAWYNADLVETRRAVEGAPEDGMARLARAIVVGNGCALSPPQGERFAAFCATFPRLFQQARRQLEGSSPRWLWFEAVWPEAVVHNRRALAHHKAGRVEQAVASWRATLAVCDLGEPYLAAAPVNDRELAEECAHAAGGLGDVETFVRWGAWLRDDAVRDRGEVTRVDLERIFRNAHPACAALPLSSRNPWGELVPAATGAGAWCAAAGMVALGCPELALANIPHHRSEAFPWDALSEVAERSTSSCWLTSSDG